MLSMVSSSAYTLFAFVLVIGLLVFIHEFGHYSMARLCGVKVLRFSIGFGPTLFAFNRKGTEWALCLIPLGGYVKMLDEREAPVPSEEKPLAFNNKSVGKKMAIVAAGPLANLLLAIILYTGILMQGEPKIRPWVSFVVPQSYAEKAGFRPGDKIVSVNGRSVSDWKTLYLSQFNFGGDQVVFSVVPAGTSKVIERKMVFPSLLDVQKVKNGESIGLSPYYNTNIIGKVIPKGVADSVGLKRGDALLEIDGNRIVDINNVVEKIRANPGKRFSLKVRRDNQIMEVSLVPRKENVDSKEIGLIGVAFESDSLWKNQLYFIQKYSFFSAVDAAFSRVYEVAELNLKMMGRMLVGNASLKNLSGPITIADMAGKTFHQGWIIYISFVAAVSVSLGVLNLLPIPVLDGGHLLYYVVEFFRKKPLSLRTQVIGQYVGFVILMFVMSLAIVNDISRLF